VTSTLRHRLTLVTTALVLGLALPVAAQVAGPAAQASSLAAARTAASPGVQASIESQLLSLTNSARTRAGLPALASSSTLVSIARGWSAKMAAAHRLSHNPSLASSVSGWYSLGENVAQAGSAAQAQSLFMGSSEHRANILEPLYNRVGIGVVRASDGTLWFTVDFEQTAGYKPPASKPATHRTTTHRAPATRASTSTSSAAARRAAAARASRSQVRRPVPALAAAPTATASPQVLAQRLTTLDGAADLSAAAAAPRAVAFTPAGSGGPTTPRPLLVLGLLAAALVMGAAGPLHLRRGPR
jgi:uncharacterized protein YkwD